MAKKMLTYKNGVLTIGSGAVKTSGKTVASGGISAVSGDLYSMSVTSTAGTINFLAVGAVGSLTASGLIAASAIISSAVGAKFSLGQASGSYKAYNSGTKIGKVTGGVVSLTAVPTDVTKIEDKWDHTGVDLTGYTGSSVEVVGIYASSVTAKGPASGVNFKTSGAYKASITGGLGADTYSIGAGTTGMVIEDAGGADIYSFGAKASGKFTLTDKGTDADTYTFAGAASGVSLTDNGGNNTWSFGDALKNSTVVSGEGADTYTFTGTASGVSLTDKGGDNVWNFNSSAVRSSIESGTGVDTYTIKGKASGVTLSDKGGADVYNFNSSAHLITINNAEGVDTVTFAAAASGVTLSGKAGVSATFKAKTSGVDASGLTGTATLTANIGASATITGSNQADTFNITKAANVSIAGLGDDTVNVNAAQVTVVDSVGGGNITFNLNKSSAKVVGGAGNDSFVLAEGVGDFDISSTGGDDVLVLGGKNTVDIGGNTIKKIDVTKSKNDIDASQAGAAIEWSISGSAASNELTASPNGDTFNVTGGTKNTIRGAVNGKETVNVNGDGIELYLANMNVSSSNDVVTLTGTKNTIGLSSAFTGELEISAAGNTVAVDGKYDKTVTNATISATAAGFTYDGSKAKSNAVGVTVNVAAGATSATIKGGKGADVYNLEAVPATINGGTGADFYNVNSALTDLVIEHDDANAVINVSEAGAGSKITGPTKNGATYSLAGSKVTLEAGSGADVIAVSADGASVNAGAGNDIISVLANQTATVNAGAGNDSITVNAGAAVAATLGDGKDVVDLGKGATVTIADLDTSHSDRITFGANTADSAVVMAQDANSVTLAFYSGSGVIGTVVSNKGLNSIKDIKVNTAEDKTIRELLGGADSVPATQKDALPSSATAKAVDLGKLTDGSGYAYIGPSGVVTDTTGSSAGVGVAKNYSYVADPNGTPVDISAAGANHAWNITGSKGSEMITASSFGDTLNGSGGKDSIVGGAGADYIYAHNGDLVKLGGAGTGVDTVDVTGTEANATVTVHGSVSPEDVIKVGNVNNVAVDTAQAGVLTATNSNGDKVSLDVDMNLGNTGYGAHVSDGVNPDKFIGWVDKTTAGLLDARGYNQDLTLYGDTNQLADTVIGGNGRDTIYGSAGDSVYGAEGNDLVTLTDTEAQRENVGLTKTGGVDTVVGFKTGFDATSDQVAFFEDDRGVGSAKIDANGNVIVSAGNGELQINGAAAADDSGKANGAAFFMIKDKNGESSAVALGTEQSTISADATTGEYADIYLGVSGPNGTTVDFTNNNSALALDLANTGKYGSAASPITFVGITNVKGAANQRNTIVGSADMEDVIYGGANGHNSLWGGGIGNDVLVGQQDSDDYFYYGNGEGNDTIQGFTVGTNKQSDKVVLFSGYATGAERRVESDGTNVLNVYWSDGEVLTINKINSGASGDSLSSGHGVDDVYRYGSYAAGDTRLAKVGYADTINTFAYDSAVTEYYGNSDDSDIGNNDVLTVGAEVTAARIYLDGSSYDGAVNTKYRGITNIDASKNKGNVELAGGQLADSIVGGQGANSIWGGAGTANDTLVGGTGKNTFYFNFGEGNDTIMNSGASDKVVIYGANIADAVGELNGSDYVATLTDGSKLTINNIQNGFKASFMDKTVTYSDGRFA